MTIRQALTEQVERYNLNRLTNRQSNDLHLLNTLANSISIREQRREEILRKVQRVFPGARLRNA